MASLKMVAVVGATGVVGREMRSILEQRCFPTSRVVALASPRSADKKLAFRDGEITIQAAAPDAFSLAV